MNVGLAVRGRGISVVGSLTGDKQGFDIQVASRRGIAVARSALATLIAVAPPGIGRSGGVGWAEGYARSQQSRMPCARRRPPIHVVYLGGCVTQAAAELLVRRVPMYMCGCVCE